MIRLQLQAFAAELYGESTQYLKISSKKRARHAVWMGLQICSSAGKHGKLFASLSSIPLDVTRTVHNNQSIFLCVMFYSIVWLIHDYGFSDTSRHACGDKWYFQILLVTSIGVFYFKILKLKTFVSFSGVFKPKWWALSKFSFLCWRWHKPMPKRQHHMTQSAKTNANSTVNVYNLHRKTSNRFAFAIEAGLG